MARQTRFLTFALGAALVIGQWCCPGLLLCATPNFANVEELDLHCLRTSYPAIADVRTAADGSRWLVLAGESGERQVLYAPAQAAGGMPDYHVSDVRTSMQLPYPLEPERPDLPPRVSPGRWRSMELLAALYGNTAAEVRQRLVVVNFLGRRVALAPEAAKALAAVADELAPLAAQDAGLRALLVSGGGFTWRRVAGEDYLSPHAFGIAIDISPGRATYWRWSPLRPHPLQKTYPATIVEAFERQGFVWGGKWHEYDLMHFEYRPEIICKARLSAADLSAKGMCTP